MKNHNGNTPQAMKHGLTKRERLAHKQARKQRQRARGKQWEVMA